MADRQRAKSWTNSTDQELLGEYEKLVKKLQDPAYAGIDPSTTKDAPMHVLDRGTLASLESELERRGVTYTPAQGRITPMPVAPRGPRPTINTPAASTTPPTPTPAPAPSPAPAAAPTPQPAAPTPQPAAPTPQPAAPTPAPTAAPTATTKPVGRPVTSATTSPPSPTGAGAQQVSAQVTQTGNATPKPVAKITAAVQNTPPPPAKVITSGAPTPRPLLKKTGDDISRALLDGTKGTRNIKLAGAAALLGLGAFAVSRNARSSSDDYERKLEMQRRGMMM